MEISIKEVEINKISLSPGDILIVKCFGDDIPSSFVQEFGAHLKRSFPDNKIELLLMSPGNDIIFEKVALTEGEQND